MKIGVTNYIFVAFSVSTRIKGFIKKKYNFVENDLINKGYIEACLGVEPREVRNIQIYFHLEFKEYIKTIIQYNQNEEVVNFYKKKIK